MVLLRFGLDNWVLATALWEKDKLQALAKLQQQVGVTADQTAYGRRPKRSCSPSSSGIVSCSRRRSDLYAAADVQLQRLRSTELYVNSPKNPNFSGSLSITAPGRLAGS